MTSLTLEFTGGSELLVGGKEHKVTVPSAEDGVLTVRQLLDWIRHNLITERPELLIEGDTVRPGILVLVNECDWELLEQADSRLKSGDIVTFISTLHGG